MLPESEQLELEEGGDAFVEMTFLAPDLAFEVGVSDSCGAKSDIEEGYGTEEEDRGLLVAFLVCWATVDSDSELDCDEEAEGLALVFFFTGVASDSELDLEPEDDTAVLCSLVRSFFVGGFKTSSSSSSSDSEDLG